MKSERYNDDDKTTTTTTKYIIEKRINTITFLFHFHGIFHFQFGRLDSLLFVLFCFSCMITEGIHRSHFLIHFICFEKQTFSGCYWKKTQSEKREKIIDELFLLFFFSIFIFVYVCMCVCIRLNGWRIIVEQLDLNTCRIDSNGCHMLNDNTWK